MDGPSDSNLPLEDLEDDEEEISLENDTENALGKWSNIVSLFQIVISEVLFAVNRVPNKINLSSDPL